MDDLFDRVGEAEGIRITEGMWKSREDKKTVQGIHGTLFYQLDFKREFYPTKREGKMVHGLQRRTRNLSSPDRSAGTTRVHIEKGSVDGNATEFFVSRSLEPLPPADRAAWEQYLERSERIGASDRASMEAELKSDGRASMTPAPFRKAFRMEPRMTAEWFHGQEAAQMVDSVLSYQTPSGGWSKHVEYGSGPRRKGQSYYSENASWQYIATIDNDSTTEQLRFLAAAYSARSEPRYRDAFLRGIDYLFLAQFPNGCWPQVFPLQGGYHDGVTYNDDAIINVMRLLGDVARGQWELVPQDMRSRAAERVAQGLGCIVQSQVTVGGARAVWAQQHHPLTLAPNLCSLVRARGAVRSRERSHRCVSHGAPEPECAGRRSGSRCGRVARQAPHCRVRIRHRSGAPHVGGWRPAMGAALRDRNRSTDLQQSRRGQALRLERSHRPPSRVCVVARSRQRILERYVVWSKDHPRARN